jgi:DNA helicase-2/ATP-dependent DNA helicase PcrA
MRLLEGSNEVDLCLGKATFIKSGVRIVDWRNAPISKIFYRYRQDDEYEEEIAGRLRSGSVKTRRTTAIRDATLERIDSPEGAYLRDYNGGQSWRHIAKENTRLSGGQGAALRVHQGDTPPQRRLGSDDQGLHQRADKHLPDIASLIDPEQFELITRPSSGLVVVRGSAGSGKTTVALHRIAYLAYADETIESERTCSWSFRPRCATTSVTCCRHWASNASGCRPTATGPPSIAAACSPRCRAPSANRRRHRCCA